MEETKSAENEDATNKVPNPTKDIGLMFLERPSLSFILLLDFLESKTFFCCFFNKFLSHFEIRYLLVIVETKVRGQMEKRVGVKKLSSLSKIFSIYQKGMWTDEKLNCVAFDEL